MLKIYLNEYCLLVYIFISALILVSILFIISLKFGFASYRDREKVSSYECGFDPFGDREKEKKQFDIKYYLLAILFLIFDLELVLLLPWLFVYEQTNVLSFILVLFFLSVLIIGFIYELVNGVLEWE